MGLRQILGETPTALRFRQSVAETEEAATCISRSAYDRTRRVVVPFERRHEAALLGFTVPLVQAGLQQGSVG